MNKNAKPFLSFIIYILLTTYFNLLLIKVNNDMLYLLLCTIQTIVIVGAFIFVNKIKIKEEFKDFLDNKKAYLKRIFIIWVIGFTLMILANYFINSSIPSNEVMIRNSFIKYFISIYISSVIFTPILEEMLYRYSLTRIKNKYIYLIVSSILFGLVHITSESELIYLIPYSILGLTFGLSYIKTNNNLISSIICHLIHNYVTLMLLLLF